MDYRQYIKVFLSGCFGILLLVGSINYYVDPAGIYPGRTGLSTSPRDYARTLVHSRNGLVWPNDSWNERDIKIELAQFPFTGKGVVLGSSRVMQLSSIRSEATLLDFKGKIINLGVSGGTLEDYLAFCHQIIHNPDPPVLIIFGIDPWSLDWRGDSRWVRYSDKCASMRELLHRDSGSDLYSASQDMHFLEQFQFLISRDHFSRSMSRMRLGKLVAIEAPDFDLVEGFKHPVLLSDGSVVYSRTERRAAINPRDATYKLNINGQQYSKSGLNTFKNLNKYLLIKGYKIKFLLAPYHHSVWNNKESNTVRILVNCESIVRKMGEELGVPVLGSYNPDTMGCAPDEFYDAIHPKFTVFTKPNLLDTDRRK